MSIIIYKILNNINGKVYIGQTKNSLDKRIYEHSKGKYLVQKAFAKYGINSFTVSIIDNAITKETSDEKEKYWIKFYDCKSPKGYNLTDGGGGLLNPSEEIRDKIRQKLKGVPQSEERKNKLRGRTLSEEHKNKLRGRKAWNKDIPWSEGHKKKLSEAHIGKPSGNKGKTHPYKSRGKRPDTSERNRKNKGRVPWNKGLKGAQIGWNKGLTKETDTRVKAISDGKKGSCRPPASEETRKKLSLSTAAYWKRIKEGDKK